MRGLVFSIKRYSVHDGPGIRVTVFLKGCPLRCRWCHNPEGLSPLPETVISTQRIGGHEFSKKEEVGKFYSVEEIMKVLEREKVFMNSSGGGVTFSGGEPMMQFDFLSNLVKECRAEGYHTTIDTSGFAPEENYEAIIPHADLFLFDIKHLDPGKHQEGTGVSNDLILSNYRFLAGSAKELALRIPVIPGFNDDPLHIEMLMDLILSTGTGSLKTINLLPFHKTGYSKYKKFNLPYLMDGTLVPSKDRMQELKAFFMTSGVKIRIGG